MSSRPTWRDPDYGYAFTRNDSLTEQLQLIILMLCLMALFGCANKTEKVDDGLIGLNNYQAEFDFSDIKQLNDLPSFGDDTSYIENGQLIAHIKKNQHKGLGRKFRFKDHGGEPNEAEFEYDIWLDDNFQKNGVENEIGKFFGFEGIYDNRAGFGGKKVTTQNSWSVRIGHAKQNKQGEIPLGLYIYHPGMKHKYGTTIDVHHSLTKNQKHNLKLYVKMNDIDKQNGVIIFTVDGKEVYNDDTWLFRNDSSVHIKSIWLNAYIGGKTPSNDETYLKMDNFKIKW